MQTFLSVTLLLFAASDSDNVLDSLLPKGSKGIAYKAAIFTGLALIIFYSLIH